MKNFKHVSIIGAGLAGCEAAYQLSKRGIKVMLYDSKPHLKTPAHSSDYLAELVCSNSLKSNDITTGSGLLKQELRILDSLIIKTADECRVPAGGALAVDREAFSKKITQYIKNDKNIQFISKIVSDINNISDGNPVIIAAGPLIMPPLSIALEEILQKTPCNLTQSLNNCNTSINNINNQDGSINTQCSDGSNSQFLHFYDAAAPIIDGLSIDLTKAFYANRYGKGDSTIDVDKNVNKHNKNASKNNIKENISQDSINTNNQNANNSKENQEAYLNCPLSKEEYEHFISELTQAKRAPQRDFEINVFEGCMPIEIMAKRGADTLRFGPLKPVGLIDNNGKRPYAVVQLRRENSNGSMFNMVGFQTNLTFLEQKRVFGMIPALKNAEFLRYGVMHRNSYVNAPKVLNRGFSLVKNPSVYIAGQLSGVEGYCESVMSGIAAVIHLLYNKILPNDSLSGALCNYLTLPSANFQPMNANFGLFPTENSIRDKKKRKEFYAARAIESITQFNNMLT